MRTTILYEGDQYRLTSYGNGWAYTLADTANGLDVFVQDEDADTMRTELEAIELSQPDSSPDDILSWLWDQCGYGMVAQPVPDAAYSEVYATPSVGW